MKNFVIVIMILIVSGCVVKPPLDGPIVAREEQRVICKKEKPTGSNRPVKVCRAAPGVLDREDTERDMRVIQRQSEQLGSPP